VSVASSRYNTFIVCFLLSISLDSSGVLFKSNGVHRMGSVSGWALGKTLSGETPCKGRTFEISILLGLDTDHGDQ
jgi:hypothetical protein